MLVSNHQKGQLLAYLREFTLTSTNWTELKRLDNSWIVSPLLASSYSAVLRYIMYLSKSIIAKPDYDDHPYDLDLRPRDLVDNQTLTLLCASLAQVYPSAESL